MVVVYNRRAFTWIINVILVLGLVLGAGKIALGDDTYIRNGVIAAAPGGAPEDDCKLVKPLGNGYNRYYDYPHGYAVNFPADMEVDCSLSAVKTVMFNPSTRLEIYHDDFNGTVHYAAAYTKCSRDFLKNKKDHTVTLDKKLKVKGLTVNLLQWQRSKLFSLPGDKNYYLSAEIIKNSREVYTLIIKSSAPLGDWMPVINSFEFMPKNGIAANTAWYAPPGRSWPPETAQFYDKYFGPSSALRWGIFEPTAGESMGYLEELEKSLDHHFDFLLWYQGLYSAFPRQLADRAYERGKYLELTLHSWVPDADNSSVIYDLLNGKYDGYYESYAREVKSFGHPILLRWNNEMNGDWCAWSAYYYSKDPELFKAAWRHVYGIFQREGADNALWVWNPNEMSFPGFKWNHCLNYFPGSAYVDIIGLTGYNTGNYYRGETWRAFGAIYGPLYTDYNKYFNYPFMITEFGSNLVGGDKAAWIKDMFTQIKYYKKIKAAIWFNGIDCDAQGRAARTYRLTREEDIQAFAEGLQGLRITPDGHR